MLSVVPKTTPVQRNDKLLYVLVSCVARVFLPEIYPICIHAPQREHLEHLIELIV